MKEIWDKIAAGDMVRIDDEFFGGFDKLQALPGSILHISQLGFHGTLRRCPRGRAGLAL